MLTRALSVARSSDLIEPDRPLLVLLSGGADSVCLVDVALCIGARVNALHLNYGNRAGADADEAHCRALCEHLGVPLTVERPTLPSRGNFQASARDARYAAAERLAKADYATAHTASDQAETVVYRLAISPGSRPLAGMPSRRGRLVRPLLEATRADTREHCRAAGLSWREDPSNADPRFARARIRHEIIPVLEELAPGATTRIALTSGLLREEQRLLDTVVADVLVRLGSRPALDEIRNLDPPLRRLAVRRLAERAGAPTLSGEATERVISLGEKGGSAALDVGAGVRAVVEYGRLHFSRARPRASALSPPSQVLEVPGKAGFGRYVVEAELGASPHDRDAALAAAAVGRAVTLRAWSAGDRMRPAGLGGTKKLQDLFTDRKVPREQRREIPLVVVGDEVAWVPGVAVDERFAALDGEEVVTFRATRVDPAEGEPRVESPP